MKKYYKVCSRKKGLLRSCVVVGSNCLLYFIDTWTFPRKYMLDLGLGIAVFTNKKEAIGFAYRKAIKIEAPEVWECNIRLLLERPSVIHRSFHHLITKSTIVSLFNQYGVGKHESILPKSTVFTDAVKLIKRIK